MALPPIQAIWNPSPSSGGKSQHHTAYSSSHKIYNSLRLEPPAPLFTPVPSLPSDTGLYDFTVQMDAYGAGGSNKAHTYSLDAGLPRIFSFLCVLPRPPLRYNPRDRNYAI